MTKSCLHVYFLPVFKINDVQICIDIRTFAHGYDYGHLLYLQSHKTKFVSLYVDDVTNKARLKKEERKLMLRLSTGAIRLWK